MRKCKLVIYPTPIWGPSFTSKAYGSGSYRWCERYSASGLRFVGEADKVYQHIHHQGWYTDDDYGGEVMRGAVWQLPAKDGKARFLAGVLDPNNSDSALFSMDVYMDENSDNDEAKKQAARDADRLAERMADDEREHNKVFHASVDYEELGNNLKENRKETLAMFRVLKIIKEGPNEFECKALTKQIMVMIDRREEIMRKRDELLNDFGNHKAWGV